MNLLIPQGQRLQLISRIKKKKKKKGNWYLLNDFLLSITAQWCLQIVIWDFLYPLFLCVLIISISPCQWPWGLMPNSKQLKQVSSRFTGVWGQWWWNFHRSFLFVPQPPALLLGLLLSSTCLPSSPVPTNWSCFTQNNPPISLLNYPGSRRKAFKTEHTCLERGF